MILIYDKENRRLLPPTGKTRKFFFEIVEYFTFAKQVFFVFKIKNRSGLIEKKHSHSAKRSIQTNDLDWIYFLNEFNHNHLFELTQCIKIETTWHTDCYLYFSGIYVGVGEQRKGVQRNPRLLPHFAWPWHHQGVVLHHNLGHAFVSWSFDNDVQFLSDCYETGIENTTDNIAFGEKMDLKLVFITDPTLFFMFHHINEASLVIITASFFWHNSSSNLTLQFQKYKFCLSLDS